MMDYRDKNGIEIDLGDGVYYTDKDGNEIEAVVTKFFYIGNRIRITTDSGSMKVRARDVSLYSDSDSQGGVRYC